MSADSRPPPPRRLAFVVPQLRLGGGELSMVRLAAGLARDGLPVDLVVHTLAGAEIAVPPSLRLVQLGTDGTLGSVAALARWLGRERPRWLVSAFPHTNVAAVAAARWSRSGCRTVLTEHAPLSLQIERQGGWRWRALPPLVRWAYPRADAVVAVSRGVRDDVLALAGPRVRLLTIANPVLDDDAGADATGLPGTPPHRWLRDPRLHVVLSVSRLGREKDVPTLVAAFERLHAARPQARLLLAGTGPAREEIAAAIAARGLSAVAELVGPVSNPRAWMKRAAVFALASTYEGFGNVLVEALSCGTAVVSTDCPVGPREILQDGRWGALVPVGDAAAMARALQAAVDAPGAPDGATEYAAGFTTAAACAAWRPLLDALAQDDARC